MTFRSLMHSFTTGTVLGTEFLMVNRADVVSGLMEYEGRETLLK